MKLDNSHAWAVQVTLPADQSKGRRWAHNDTITVITTGGIDGAMRAVMAEYPDAKIWAANHSGSRTVLILDVPTPSGGEGKE